MDKFKYIILGFLISSAAIAQDNQPPQIDLPSQSDELEDPLAGNSDELDLEEQPKEEAKPAVTAPTPELLSSQPAPQDKKILDKAIQEVFEEPKEEAKPTEVKKEEKPSTEADVEVTVSGESDAPMVDESAAPVEEPARNEEKPVEEAKPAEPVKEEAEKAQVAPEKFEEPKAEPVKEEVKLPAESPKSVRESYEPKFEGEATNEPAPAITTPVVEKKSPAKKSSSSGLPANVYLLNDVTAPTTPKVNVPVQPVQPVKAKKKVAPSKKQLPKSMQRSEAETAPLAVTEEAPTVTATEPVNARQLPESMKQGSLESDDLDLIAILPTKEKSVDIKEDIVIDRGNFSDPFGGSSSEQTQDPQALAEVTDTGKKKDDSSVPVVDFSDTNAPDIDSTRSSSENIDSFYMQDTGLEVEVKDAPQNSLGAMKNAYDALQVGQYESAINYYNDALTVSPNNRKALFGLATAYHMNKQYDQARDVYLKLIKLDPNYWPAVNNYIIMVTEENPEKSVSRLEELYSRNPTFAAIPAQLGSLYFRQGNLQKSAEYYTNAVKLEPKNTDYRYNLAIVLEKGGNYKDAAIIYKTLLEDASKGANLPEDPVAIRDRLEELLSKR